MPLPPLFIDKKCQATVNHGSLPQPCHVQKHDGCPPENYDTTVCDTLDVCYLLGKGGSNLKLVWDATKNNIKTDAASLLAQAATSGDVRVSCITVDSAGTITAEVPWTSDVATFNAGIDGITDDQYRRARDMNGGHIDAVAGTGIGAWRGNPTQKVIFAIGDALAGGTDDDDTTPTAVFDNDDWVSSASTGLAADIITHTILIRFDIFINATLMAALESQYQEVASSGGGTYRNAFNVSVGELFAELLEVTCYEDGGSEGDGYTADGHLWCCSGGNCLLCGYFEEYGVKYRFTMEWKPSPIGRYVGTVEGVEVTPVQCPAVWLS